MGKITSVKGEYPALLEFAKLTSGTNTVERAIPWPVRLLPRLDAQTTYDQFMTNNTGTGYDYGKPVRLEVFVCPSDGTTNPSLGTISYVLNSGMPDVPNHPLQADQVADVKANGMAHDLRRGRSTDRIRAGADIRDGADTTLLLSENIHRDETTWLGPVQNPAFSNVVGSLVTDLSMNPEQRYGFVWDYATTWTPGTWPQFLAPINREPDTATGSGYSELSNGTFYARPASAHPEVVIVTFAGGNTREISETIDYVVYQQLMTPNGLKAANNKVKPPAPFETGAAKTFMSKPLNSSEY
jgi:hypothetical protein